MKTFFVAWHTFWTRSIPPHSLAVLRIALGIFLIIYALTYAPHLTMVFSNRGFVLPLFAMYAPGWLAPFLHPPPPLVVIVLYSALLLSLLSFTAGYRMRLSGFLILLFALWFWQLSLHLFPASYNRIFLFLLIVFSCSGADRTFSVRMLRAHGKWSAWEPISILPLRLIALQISFTYAGVGLQKFWLPDWQTGEALYTSLIGIWGTPLAFWFVQQLPQSIFPILEWCVKIFEAIIPFGLWIPRIRWVFFFLGSCFHIAIALLLGIWWFLFLIPAYIVFLPPERVAKFFRARPL